MTQEKKQKTWLTTYLVTFILLHNIALITKHDADYAKKHGMSVSCIECLWTPRQPTDDQDRRGSQERPMSRSTISVSADNGTCGTNWN